MFIQIISAKTATLLEHHRWKETQRIESHQVLLKTMSKDLLSYAVETRISNKIELEKNLSTAMDIIAGLGHCKER